MRAEWASWLEDDWYRPVVEFRLFGFLDPSLPRNVRSHLERKSAHFRLVTTGRARRGQRLASFGWRGTAERRGAFTRVMFAGLWCGRMTRTGITVVDLRSRDSSETIIGLLVTRTQPRSAEVAPAANFARRVLRKPWGYSRLFICNPWTCWGWTFWGRSRRHLVRAQDTSSSSSTILRGSCGRRRSRLRTAPTC